MIIKGNTVGTTMPRANWNQTDPAKADYIIGKEEVDDAIQAAQEAADYAQSAADDAQATADDALSAANDAQSAADDAQATADDAMAAAEDAQITAEDAYDLADSKAQMATEALVLRASGWSDNEQWVQSILEYDRFDPVFVSPDPGDANFKTYTECGVRCIGGDGQGLGFVCDDVPSIDLTVNTVGFK